MRFPTVTSPHTERPNSVTWTMLWVIIALVPGSIAMTWYFGWGIRIYSEGVLYNVSGLDAVE